jgi:hypothetical protein
MDFSEEDLKDLRRARALLEKPSFAAKISILVGLPLEKGFKVLPAGWSNTVQSAAQSALFKALDFAVSTLEERDARAPANLLHKISVAATGALGGALGFPTLALELSLSTTIMLRSIADIARSEGEEIQTIDGKLSCLEVFGLAGSQRAENPAETGYYAARAALAGAVAEAARYIALQGLREQSAPALVRLIAAIAARFGVVVSEKLAAQALPVIGAAGGAFINTIFISHFQDAARGHFIVRRLERKYGADAVRARYERL